MNCIDMEKDLGMPLYDIPQNCLYKALYADTPYYMYISSNNDIFVIIVGAVDSNMYGGLEYKLLSDEKLLPTGICSFKDSDKSKVFAFYDSCSKNI